MQIWNVSNGELLHSCAPVLVEGGAATHGGWVTDLRFSPDGKMLVSAGGYLKVRVSPRLKEKTSLYPALQAVFTSCSSVGPHKSHQRGRAVTAAPYRVMSLKSASPLSPEFSGVLLTVLGTFSVMLPHIDS